MNPNWEQFELTGSVEDYLTYRQETGGKSDADIGTGEEEHGTDGSADRPGIGGIPLRGL